MSQQSDKSTQQFFFDDFNWINASSSLSFGNDLKDYGSRYKNFNLAWTPNNNTMPYQVNSMGYRTDEFKENRDLIFAGCSQTWGEGVLYDGIWGNILSDKVNLRSYNLGLSGRSTQFIVQNLMGFFKEYGKPKVLFCLFPEFTRIQMQSDISFMKSIHQLDKGAGRKSYPVLPQSSNPNRNLMYSKTPHIAEEIIPSEFIFAINLDYIKLLENYCDLNKIKLFWGTWDRFQDEYINKNIKQMDFKHYVYLEQDKWETRKEDGGRTYFHLDGDVCHNINKGPCTSHTKCHQHEKELYGDNFDLSMDYHSEHKTGHNPIHVNIHIAEIFERAFKNDTN